MPKCKKMSQEKRKAQLKEKRKKEDSPTRRARLEDNRRRNEDARLNEDEQTRRARLEDLRRTSEDARLNEDEQTRRARLEDLRRRSEDARLNEDEQTRRARLEDLRRRSEDAILKEEEQTRKARLEDKRRRSEDARLNEDEQTRRERLEDKRRRSEVARLNEDEQAKCKRLDEERKRGQVARLKEDEQIKKARLENQRKERANAKKQVSAKMQVLDEEGKQIEKVPTALSKTKNLSIEQSAERFHKRISEGPIYACIVCRRLLYRQTVVEMKANNYPQIEAINKIANESKHIKTKDTSYICKTCHAAFKKGNIPQICALNNLETVPPVLGDLNQLEMRLLCLRIPFLKLLKLPRGGQMAIQGSAVNIPTKIGIVNVLPRLPETSALVPLKLKRKMSYSGHHMHDHVSPLKVREALQWLKQNNLHYKDVNINEDWESQWKKQDPDLWTAMVDEGSAAEEIIKPVRVQNTLTEIDSKGDFNVQPEVAISEQDPLMEMTVGVKHSVIEVDKQVIPTNVFTSGVDKVITKLLGVQDSLSAIAVDGKDDFKINVKKEYLVEEQGTTMKMNNGVHLPDIGANTDTILSAIEKQENVVILIEDSEGNYPQDEGPFTQVNEDNFFENLIEKRASKFTHHNLPLTGDHYFTLCDENHLCDQVITEYLHLIKKRNVNENLMTVYSIWSPIFEDLVKDFDITYDKLVNRYIKEDLTTVDLLLIPVHLGDHWSLIAVYMKQKSIVFIDSIPTMRHTSNAPLIAKQFLEKYFFQKGLVQSFTVSIHEDAPVQGNTHDCGVFVCQNAEKIARGASICTNQTAMPTERIHMVQELLKGQLIGYELNLPQDHFTEQFRKLPAVIKSRNKQQQQQQQLLQQQTPVGQDRHKFIKDFECPFPEQEMPQTREYNIIAEKARQMNLRAHNVPGDGNCFFHAVSVAMKAQGKPVGSAPELRKKLIHYFENELDPDFKEHLIITLHNEDGSDITDPEQSFLAFINALKNGEWADNAVVQGIAELLKIKIITIKSNIGPNNVIVPRNDADCCATVVIGHIGEHYVTLISDDSHQCRYKKNPTKHIIKMHVEPQCVQSPQLQPLIPDHNSTKNDHACQNQLDKIQREEEKEDSIAYEATIKLKGLPFDTFLQNEDYDISTTYTCAPGENQRPRPLYEDEYFEELTNPTKYPSGEGGFSSKGNTKITMRKYFQHRLLHLDGRFAKDIDYLLSAQYHVESQNIKDNIQIFLRQTKGKTNAKGKIKAGVVKDLNNVQSMLRHDTAFRFLKTVRGSPAYWNAVLLDVLAMVRQLGVPTWFLTLSAADLQWPEIIQSIGHQYGKSFSKNDIKEMTWDDKCKWIRRNPVTASRQFKHRLDAFFTEFIGGKAHPIGELQDFVIRIEFQARGSPHAHCILWIKNAPKIDTDKDEEVTKFIDKYQTCEVPIEEDLCKLVNTVQKHVHSKTCRRQGSCRFHFPHLPSDATVIAKESDKTNLNTKKEVCKKVMEVMENPDYPDNITLEDLLKKASVDPCSYRQALQIMKSGKKIVLKRKPAEKWLNNYNSHILKHWQANMDLQYIVDPYSCIMYITSYMMKSEGAMSELLKQTVTECDDCDVKSKLKKVGSVFLNSREVSAQEATFRILSIPLKQCSRAVVFVNTAPPDKRVSLLKPRKVLEEMNDDDEEIFCTSLVDRYAARPDDLHNLCLAEFAASYVSAKRASPDEPDHISVIDQEMGQNEKIITLKNGLGTMRRRNRQCVIRFHQERKEGEDKYRNLLMLYLPWRDESDDLKGNFVSYQAHYQDVEIHVKTNESKFSIRAEEINEAYDNLQQNGPPDDAWDMIAPNIGFEQAEQQAEGFVIERDLPNENPFVNIDIGSEPTESDNEKSLFSKEIDPSLMSLEQYKEMTHSLNEKQKEFISFHKDWLKKAEEAIVNSKPVPQFSVFLSGHGGVGKSHVIKLVHYETMKILRKCPGYFLPNDIPVLRTAFTGTAAFGIDGMTLHSALGLAVGPKKKGYQKPSSSKLNTLRVHLGKLMVLIIDEASMVGADLLYDIHCRLQDIKENTDPDLRFGGVSVLAVGDLYQLQPVAQKHLFSEPSDDYARLHGSIWKEKFKMFELTESMRQKDDVAFSDLLLRVRKAECTEEDIALLQSREVSTTSEDYPSQAVHVFKTNHDVDHHNMNQLYKLDIPVEKIKAIDQKKDIHTGLVNITISKKPSETGGLHEIVSIAKGARVMITVNIDVSDGLVNGVCGTVEGLNKVLDKVQVVFVSFDSKRIGSNAIAKSSFKSTYPHAVPIKRHDVQFYAGRGHKPIMARRSQFPLTLAWACTIHKVQGKTLEKIVVSMRGKGNFFAGQAYVALSRVKKITDLHILQFDKNAIKVDKEVVREMKRLPHLTFYEDNITIAEE